MTVIIGFTNKSGGYIASDGLTSAEYHVISKHQNKIKVFNDNLGIACSGLCRINTLIRNRLTVEKNHNQTDEQYIFNVCEKIKAIIVEGVEINDDSAFNVILIYNNGIYTMDRSYDVSVIKERYFAEGHGSTYAMGAMYAVETRCDFKNKESKQYAEYVIQAGLDAAIQHSCGCGGDTQIIKIGNA